MATGCCCIAIGLCRCRTRKRSGLQSQSSRDVVARERHAFLAWYPARVVSPPILRSQSGSQETSRALALVDGVLLLAALVLVSLVGYGIYGHDVFEEWDGVAQYFAGSALLSGGAYVGWASHFWPPLQPLLLALFGAPFLTGKVIAACSFAGIGVAAYLFGRLHLGPGVRPWYVVLLVCSSTVAVKLALQVENHALETCLAFAAFTLYSYWLKDRSSTRQLVSVAVVLSLAALTRYSSLGLAAVLCLHILWPRRRADVRNAAMFCLVFVLVQSVWWIPNYILNGSPLATWQYQNVGVAVFPGDEEVWWWKEQAGFHGLRDVIQAYPVEWIRNFTRNVIKCAYLIVAHVGSSPAAGVLLALGAVGRVASVGAAFSVVKRHGLAIAACVAFSALCSVAFVFPEALMPVIVVAAASLSVEALRATDQLFIRRLALCVVVLNLAGSAVGVRDYLVEEETDRGQLVDLDAINAVLTADADIHSKVVESAHPARALYAGARWVEAPGAGVFSVCDVLEDRIDPIVRARTVTYPADLDVAAAGIDYLVVDRALDDHYTFVSLSDLPSEGSCSSLDWKTVYRSSDAAVVRATRH